MSAPLPPAGDPGTPWVLVEAISAAADDQRQNYPELSDAEAADVIRRNFYVFEDSPDFVFNRAWGVSADAADPLAQAYVLVIRATPEMLARALDA